MGIGSTDTCTFTLCIFFLFLKEGLSTIAYVREGKTISMTCPTSNNVYTWIKLPFAILADCNKEMPEIAPGVNVTDDCKNLIINNSTINDEGTYRCISGIDQNRTQHNVILKTQYPPVVQDTKVIFRTNSASRILKCNASGEPEVYTFSAWHHHTYNNDWIRDLHGDANGNLILSDNHTRKDNWYEDSGVYTCNVTNGVSDESDNLWQNGKITVIVEGELDEKQDTSDDTKVSGMQYIFGFILAIIIPGCLFVIWWCLKKAKKKDSHSEGRENDQHESAGAIVNNLYGSASDIDASPSTSGVRTDFYSSINRREKISDRQNVTYNIDGEGRRSQTELTDTKEWKTNIATGSSTLNYVEVDFGREQPKGKYLIHGADNRTPYADIDFTAKAEPLISSDEDDKGSNSGINVEDDFMSLEDVQQWNINAD